jgi:hypothetical protein
VARRGYKNTTPAARNQIVADLIAIEASQLASHEKTL